MNVTAPENTPAIDRAEKHNSWLLKGIAAGVLVLVLAMAVTFYLRGRDSAKQSTTQHSVNAIVQSTRREDCARYYGGLFTDVDRAQRIAAADGQIALGKYLIGDPSITPEVLKAAGTAVTKANTEVKALPSVNDAVNHGFTLDGKTYPPCPTVK